MDIIQLQDVVIKASSTQYKDLLNHAQLSVQLIVDGKAVFKTKLLECESTEAVWRLKDGIQLPAATPYFLLAIICDTDHGNSKQLCTILLSNEIILDQSVNQGPGCIKYDLEGFRHSRFPHGVHALHLQFRNKDLASHLLQIESEFSADLYACVIHGSFEDHGFQDGLPAENMIAHLLSHIRNTLESKPEVGKDLEKVVYERVLLLSNTSENKSQFLQTLGDVALKSYYNSDSVAFLDRAISMYEAAVQNIQEDDSMQGACLIDLGNTLMSRFEELGDLGDINKAVKVFEQAVELTPDGHPDKPSMLNKVGNSLCDRFRELDDLSDINKAIMVFEEAAEHSPDDHPNKLSMLCNVGSSLCIRFQELGDISDIDKAIVMFEKALDVIPDLHHHKSSVMNDVGSLLYNRFEQLGDLNDINKAIVVLDKAIELTPDTQSNKPAMASNLGHSLSMRFKKLGDLSDINKAIVAFEQATNLTSDKHADMPAKLNSFGTALYHRFTKIGGISDISKAIVVFEKAADLTPDGHPDKPSVLSNIGSSLYDRFESLGDLNDINKAILVHEQAVNLTPHGHSEKPLRLKHLGSSLCHRFKQLHDIGDINKAIEMLEQAIYIAPDGDPNKHLWLNSFANSLSLRFGKLGNQNDINKAISTGEQIMDLIPNDHPDKPSRLSNLGCFFCHRFERFGDLDDIKKAILMCEKAKNLLPISSTEKSLILANLGRSHLSCFERLGNLSDINKAVAFAEQAVDLIPDDQADKSSRLDSFGNSLLCQFEKLGNLHDINKAVVAFEKAVNLTPEGHAEKASRLNNLAGSLSVRFGELDDLIDIERAILLHEHVVNTTSDNHPYKRSWLSNFGNSLSQRFERLHDYNDINKAVIAIGKAVDLTPDHYTDKPLTLNNLGNILCDRFEQLHNVDDINESILVFEKALVVTPDDHAEKPSILNNLGNVLLKRFDQLGTISDIIRGIEVFQQAVKLTPDGHANRPSILYNLGNALFSYSEQSNNSESINDLDKAISCWSSAAVSSAGATAIRFSACSKWAQYSSHLPNNSTIEAYNIALNLLSELAWLGLSIEDQHFRLLNAGNIVRNAVSAAIANNQIQTALEWLEQGHSVIWGQLLQLRAPLDDLEQAYPALAYQLKELSRSLEGTRPQHHLSNKFLNKTLQLSDTLVHNHHDLAYERRELLNKIRTLHGFDRFLLPHTLSQLLPAASTGPVITINIGQKRCDALVIVPNLDNVLHIALNQFSYQKADQLYKSMRFLLRQRGVARDVDRKGALVPMHPVNLEAEFENILTQLWLDIAKPILDGLAITTSGLPIHKLPHVWWCLTGPLAFLPIHAAGLYGPNAKDGSKLSDFVVSSYTPTLTALCNGSSPRILQKQKLLTVALPKQSKPGLPGTQVELDRICRQVGAFPILQLFESKATVDSVVDGMKECSWVHFACHGVQNISNPTESALILAGGSELSLSKIIKLSLPHAELAYLSACQTATGTEDLAEEAVYLAAGMLLAGYRGVIATMWSIQDADGPIIADDVYSHLFKHSQPDATQAAYALHLAVQNLCKKSKDKKSFFSWVPFIHIGV